GTSWLDFQGTGSTAHSGTRVLAGANFDPNDINLRIVDLTNFVEFRVLDSNSNFFQICVEPIAGSTIQVLFRADLNGSTIVGTQQVTTGQFVSFLSSTSGIQNVLVQALGGGSFWVDDVTAEARTSTTPVPEPGTVILFSAGVLGLVVSRWWNTR